MNLGGLSVLVTRPRDRAAPLLQAIEEHGGSAVLLPMIDICALDAQRDADIRAHADTLAAAQTSFHSVIFISVNAVHFGLAQLRRFSEHLPEQMRVYAIGEATRQALVDAGVSVNAVAGAMNSESLLQLPDLQQVTDQRMLIVRGVGGREHLAEQLSERGASVDYLECYRRVAASLPAGEFSKTLLDGRVNAITVNSGETLQNLARHIREEHETAFELPLIVPSERVAGLARDAGFSAVIVAANAGVAATVEALGQLVR